MICVPTRVGTDGYVVSQFAAPRLCWASVSRPLDFADRFVDGVGSFVSWCLFSVGGLFWTVVVGEASDIGKRVVDGLLGTASDGGFVSVQPVLHLGFFHVF